MLRDRAIYRPALITEEPRSAGEEHISIRFNMTFPRLPCEHFSLSVYDMYGRHILNASSDSQAGANHEASVSMQVFKWGSDEGEFRISPVDAGR